MSGRPTRSAARSIRALAIATTVLLASLALAGCVPSRGSFGAAQDWLETRPSIVSVTKMSSYTDGFTQKGTLHAELDPAATDSEVEQLAQEIAVFLDRGYRNNVIVRVGRDDADFVVPEPERATFAAQLWESTVGTSNLIDAVITIDPSTDALAIHVGTMRDDALAAASEVAESVGARFAASGEAADVLVHVAGYTDAARLTQDSDEAVTLAIHGEGVFIDQPGAISVTSTPACVPDPAVLTQVEAFLADDGVESGRFALCDSLVARYIDFRPLADFVPTLRSTLDVAGLTEFPVTVESTPEDGDGEYDQPGRFVQVTPGDPAAFAVLPALETPTFAPDIRYRLADGHLEIEDPGPEANGLDVLLKAVEASGAADALTLLTLKSSAATVESAPATIAEAIPQAEMIRRSEAIGSVVLRDGEGTMELYRFNSNSPPDVDEAASALYRSKAWVGRTLTVVFKDGTLVVDNGVAGDLTLDFEEVIGDFADAWAALAG